MLSPSNDQTYVLDTIWFAMHSVDVAWEVWFHEEFEPEFGVKKRM
jgi:hypothetical protein